MIRIRYAKKGLRRTYKPRHPAAAQALLADLLEEEGACVVTPIDAWTIRTETGLKLSCSLNIYSILRHHTLPSDPHSRQVKRSREKLRTIHRLQAGKLWSLL